MVVVFVICVPPLAAVYHPVKECPSLVGVGRLPYVSLYTTFNVHLLPDEVNVDGLLHVLLVQAFPPFTLNVTVY